MSVAKTRNKRPGQPLLCGWPVDPVFAVYQAFIHEGIS
ncbi:Unknown protein sequence [Pseudomonas syringae pv. maculicola]|nr:Unknown protein sequence [Pseudomonas syringae pv. maculicola]